MRKNSTLFSSEFLIAHDEQVLKQNNNDLELVPGDAVIQNILNFSKALRIGKSKELGAIEMIIN